MTESHKGPISLEVDLTGMKADTFRILKISFIALGSAFDVGNCASIYVDVVVQFYPWFNFYFPLFFFMLNI